MKAVILSSPIVIGSGLFAVKEITQAEALYWVDFHKPENFVGHETVRLVGVEPAKERKTCTGYDMALSITTKQRLEQWREYSVEELEELGANYVLIVKVDAVLDVEVFSGE